MFSITNRNTNSSSAKQYAKLTSSSYRLKHILKENGSALATLPNEDVVEIFDDGRNNLFYFTDTESLIEHKLTFGMIGIIIKAGDQYVRKLDYSGMTDSIKEAKIFYDWTKHQHSYDCAVEHRKIPAKHEFMRVIRVNNEIMEVDLAV